MENINKILIVDDEPDILEFLSYNFRKKAFDVVIANNGKEGIAVALAEKPTLIISDILMPEMDGIEMCNEIRKNDSMHETPFIFLSAVNDDYKVYYAMLSGADQFINKPVRFEYLLSIVEELLIKSKFSF